MLDDGVAERQLKQWRIDADAGDEQAQLSLGEHYLKMAQLDEDPQPNAKLGVSFLIKSSKQGSEDATKLLIDCLDNELGQYIFPLLYILLSVCDCSCMVYEVK